jgi:hypothetical protein
MYSDDSCVSEKITASSCTACKAIKDAVAGGKDATVNLHHSPQHSKSKYRKAGQAIIKAAFSGKMLQETTGGFTEVTGDKAW